MYKARVQRKCIGIVRYSCVLVLQGIGIVGYCWILVGAVCKQEVGNKQRWPLSVITAPTHQCTKLHYNVPLYQFTNSPMHRGTKLQCARCSLCSGIWAPRNAMQLQMHCDLSIYCNASRCNAMGSNLHEREQCNSVSRNAMQLQFHCNITKLNAMEGFFQKPSRIILSSCSAAGVVSALFDISAPRSLCCIISQLTHDQFLTRSGPTISQVTQRTNT